MIATPSIPTIDVNEDDYKNDDDWQGHLPTVSASDLRNDDNDSACAEIFVADLDPSTDANNADNKINVAWKSPCFGSFMDNDASDPSTDESGYVRKEDMEEKLQKQKKDIELKHAFAVERVKSKGKQEYDKQAEDSRNNLMTEMDRMREEIKKLCEGNEKR